MQKLSIDYRTEHNEKIIPIHSFDCAAAVLTVVPKRFEIRSSEGVMTGPWGAHQVYSCYARLLYIRAPWRSDSYLLLSFLASRVT